MGADSTSDGLRPRGREILPAAVLVVVTLLALLPAMRGGFFWDDRAFLADNSLVRAPDGLSRLWLTTEPMDYFPLASSVLWIEWRLWGNHPAGYHVVNALLHASAALLIWRLLRRLKVPGAWLAGLCFGAHPVAVASAAWISEHKNTVSLPLCLLAMLAWLSYEDRGGRRRYLLALGLFLLALLAKTSVVMLPPVLLLCAWWRRGAISRKDLARTAPFFALSLALGLITIWFQGHHAIGATPVRPEGAASRIAAAGWIAWFYLFKVLLPVKLCVIYPRWNVDGSSALAFLPLALLVGGMIWLWVRRKSWGRGPLFAMGYFLLMLLPALGFVNMAMMEKSLVADHLQYAAMIGVIALAAGIVASLGGGRKKAPAMLAAAGCVAALAGLACERAWVYADETRAWSDNISRNPAAWAAWFNRSLCDRVAGRLDEAVADCTQAIALKPDSMEFYDNRAVILEQLGRYDEALRDCNRSIALNDDLAAPYVNRGYLFYVARRFPEAVRDYDRAIDLKPDNASAWCNRASALAALGEYDLAIGDFSRAIELKPDLVQAWYGRARVYAGMKEFARALEDVRTFQKLGGAPDPAFVKSLSEAAGPAK